MKTPRETTIDGLRFELVPLGPVTVAELGTAVGEGFMLASQGVPGVSGPMKALRARILENSSVYIEDPLNKGTVKKVTLKAAFDQVFDGEEARFGEWDAWSIQESGVTRFLGSWMSKMRMNQEALRSVFPGVSTGSSGDSSSQTG